MGKWYTKLAVSVLGGLMLAFSWYPHGFFGLVFFAFLPLLWLSDISQGEGRKNAYGRGMLLFYPAFLVFNFITTYWIGYCTLPGAAAAVILNALLQTLTFSAWHACKKQIPNRILQALLLITFWISFEYLHLNWDLTWPWLNIGNVFATSPEVIQWYSITGAFGGTLWVMAVNFLLYAVIRNYLDKNRRSLIVISSVLVVLIAFPLGLSRLMLNGAMKNVEKETVIKAVIAQPDTDPWVEEYSLTNAQEIDRFMEITGPFINEHTDLVVTPESSIAHGISMEQLRNGEFSKDDPRYNGFRMLDSVINLYPDVNYILGLSTFVFSDRKLSENSNKIAEGKYAEFYNTAGFYNKVGLQSHYHKSRLVPGVEKMPFPKIFGFLGEILIELGGSNSSLGNDIEQRVFKFGRDGAELGIGAAICYESVYGELVGEFVRNGASLLAVVTNDSWWDDSEGHRQHFEMSRLRAVETRRYVLRSANGGFSGVIDPCGNVLVKTKYNERTAFPVEVYAQNCKTFYVKHGDYIARISAVLSALGLAVSVFLGIRKKIKNRL